MTHLEQLKAMLESNESLKGQYEVFSPEYDGDEPTTFVMLQKRSDPQPICLAFDKDGALWNIQVYDYWSLSSQ